MDTNLKTNKTKNRPDVDRGVTEGLLTLGSGRSADLCGLSLLLQLLELLSCDEAHGFVACDQFGSSRHGGQDDVPAQAADTE